jgi:hypothetical protein
MAHWAQIDENNTVIRVTVGNDNDPDEGHAWLVENLGGTWLKCSYNTRAGIYYDPTTNEPSDDQTKAYRWFFPAKGYTYDEALDAFIPPKPFESWVLENYVWVAPIPMPEDGAVYRWDEEAGDWIEVINETA